MNRPCARPLLVAALLISAATAYADQYAFLEEGPNRGYGLPFVPPNRTEFRTGIYRLGDETVEVYLVSVDSWAGEGWQEAREATFVKSERGETVARLEHAELRIFVVFQGENRAEEALYFLNSFRTRLDYFLSRGNTGDSVPFPGILERP